MKKLFYIGILLGFFACEDVIQLDIPAEAPRLIIDAVIRVDESDSETEVVVKVSETNSFFGQIPPVGVQQITLTNLDYDCNPGAADPGCVLNENEPGSGVYSITIPTSSLTEGELLLQVTYQDNFYLAYTNYIPAVPFNSVTQGDGFLFDENDIEIVLNYTDFPDREDFYLFDFDLGNYLVSEDTFYDGEEFEFSYFYDNQLEPGTELTISILGADEQFYNYMNQLIEQSGAIDFGAFQTPAVTVRGNFINATEIDNEEFFDNVDQSNNFALGYFAVVQEFKQTLIIE